MNGFIQIWTNIQTYPKLFADSSKGNFFPKFSVRFESKSQGGRGNEVIRTAKTNVLSENLESKSSSFLPPFKFVQ